MNPNDSDASRFKSATTDRRGERDLDLLLVHVARGDTEAFEAVYDRLAGPVYGVIRRVLRDPSQSEEVTQEVLLEDAFEDGPYGLLNDLVLQGGNAQGTPLSVGFRDPCPLRGPS